MSAKLPDDELRRRRYEHTHMDLSPLDMPSPQSAGMGFGCYFDMLRCLSCGWRAYEQPWPDVCGKCSGVVMLDRALFHPATDDEERKRTLLKSILRMRELESLPALLTQMPVSQE